MAAKAVMLVNQPVKQMKKSHLINSVRTLKDPEGPKGTQKDPEEPGRTWKDPDQKDQVRPKSQIGSITKGRLVKQLSQPQAFQAGSLRL